ncbi:MULTISPECIES: hypothetical protein [Pasteurellaceae]|uniref:Uncharacterized protein n=1 Tax=Pasteurella atlantica TaxID=2827233 RepID=A0AAW8CMX8_9PAST|nr:hypothetical protein [Pasteurella atlantica]MBR0573018.1 hypothetical protein [Pasteurella atlantica]MDP8038855.1 hypothetical protein [Pasteurella atlantica]MDP8041036.1 hypothetical protein [Pasteurella atlantica]MDP8043172.1 hypothetical protein [Pasteurella atlantica]MDP8045258.1 hypothetical protein [Pasteurella atlantica]
MGFNFFNLSRFKNEVEITKSSWWDIEDYIAQNGVSNISEYLSIEDDFIAFLKEFYDEFSTKQKDSLGCGFLASHIIVHTNIAIVNDCFFYGMNKKNAIKKLLYIEKQNINFLEEKDIIFLFRCWIRELCNVYLFDVSTGSFLRASDSPFSFELMLKNYECKDIFSEYPNIGVSVTMDPEHDIEYIPPKNFGEVITEFKRH